MFTVSPRSRLHAFCRDHFFRVIFAAFGSFLCATVAATPGQLDPTFGVNGKLVTQMGNNLSNATLAFALENEQTLLVGACDIPQLALCLAKYQGDGSLDVTFGTGGRRYIPTPATEIFPVSGAKLENGGFVLSGRCYRGIGYDYTQCVWLLDSQGNLVPAFNQNATPGYVGVDFGVPAAYDTAVAVAPDGKFLVSGTCNYGSLCVARLSSAGALDASFGSASGQTKVALSGVEFGNGVRYLSVQADGRVLVSAPCVTATSTNSYDLCLIRLLVNGQLDTSFGNQGASGFFKSNLGDIRGQGPFVSIDSRQRIVLSSTCANSQRTAFCAVRLTANGSIDTAYGFGGTTIGSPLPAYSIATSAVLQVDDALVIGGWCNDGNTTAHWQFCTARFLQNGGTDITFGVPGAGYVALYARGNSDQANTIAIQPNGNIIVAGYCIPPADSVGRGFDFCAVRLLGQPYASQSCGLNVDGNLVVSVTNDSMLIVRYLIGYRGTALTSGALGPNPTRTGQALEDHLASLNLDADGDGQALAMTDGLLILRAMLGLTGDALTQGATNASHPNARNAQQILTWIESTHGVACLP